MKFSAGLPARITLGALFLAVVGGVLLDDERDRLHEILLNERSADLETALHAGQVRLHQSIDILRQDVLFLASTPPVSGIARASTNNGIDPRDKNTYATWEVRLQEIFAAFLRTHPEYFQAIYISAAGEGSELVRVDNRDGRVEVAFREALQTRGNQDYFKAGLTSTAGRVRLSEFMLDQNRGKMEEPHRPMLSAVTTVFDAGGHVFGMVVLSKDLRPLFSASSSDLPRGIQSYIADQQGRYLLHPDAKRAFAFESGSKEKIADDFPSLGPMFDPKTKQNELSFHAVTGGKGGYLAAVRVFFDAGDPTRFMLLANHLSPQTASPAQMDTKQAFGIKLLPHTAGAIGVMLLAGVIFMLILRITFSPLKRMAATARKIAAGHLKIRMPKKGAGELGELADALNAMLDKFQDRDTFCKELIGSLPGIFCMIDAQGNLLMWNRNLEQMLQRSPEEMASCHLPDCFGGEDKINIGNAIHKAIEEGGASVEAVLNAKDGTGRPCHLAGRRFERDGMPVLVWLGREPSLPLPQGEDWDEGYRNNGAMDSLE